MACDLAFDDFGFDQLEIVTDDDNVGSRRVAIRNGFTEAGGRDGRVLYVCRRGMAGKRSVIA